MKEMREEKEDVDEMREGEIATTFVKSFFR